MVTYTKISPKLVNPRDVAGNAEKEEEEEEVKVNLTLDYLIILNFFDDDKKGLESCQTHSFLS